MDPLRLIRISRSLALGFVVVATAGCRYINPQEDVETKLAQQLINHLKIYEIVSTNSPVTNMYQILSDSYPHSDQRFYPHEPHQQLLSFGEYAGFKTSVVEKYIFFLPRLVHPKFYGEAL